jgi:sugar-phosphatase
MPLTCDAVIFDLDGVVINSDVVAERHWRSWTARHGIPFEQVAAIHHGRPTVETMRLVAPHLDVAVEARVKEDAEAEDAEGLALYEGAARLLQAIPRNRWAVATSGTVRTVALRFAQLGLPDPSVLVTADDVARGKPAPDPYLLASARLGVPPRRCVVIEDAPAGIASARAAGARVIAVASTHPAEALAGADAIVSSLSSLAIAVEDDTLTVRWAGDPSPGGPES